MELKTLSSIASNSAGPESLGLLPLIVQAGALGRGEAGCFPMEVAGLWEPGPKVLGVPVCRSCTLLSGFLSLAFFEAKEYAGTVLWISLGKYSNAPGDSIPIASSALVRRISAFFKLDRSSEPMCTCGVLWNFTF